jgi:hypothetical protein
MKLVWIVAATLLFATACGSDDGAGACEESHSGTGAEWCHDFHDSGDETGEEICTRVGGEWTAGSSCADIGYTTECPSGEWVKPSGSCI